MQNGVTLSPRFNSVHVEVCRRQTLTNAFTSDTLRVKHHFHAGMAIRKALGLILLKIICGGTHGAGDHFSDGFVAVISTGRFIESAFLFAVGRWFDIRAWTCFQHDTMDFGSSGCNLLAELTFKHVSFQPMVYLPCRLLSWKAIRSVDPNAGG